MLHALWFQKNNFLKLIGKRIFIILRLKSLFMLDFKLLNQLTCVALGTTTREATLLVTHCLQLQSYLSQAEKLFILHEVSHLGPYCLTLPFVLGNNTRV